MAKKVYISVYDKSEIADYASVLQEKFDYEIVSSGGTLDYLCQNGIMALDIAELDVEEKFGEKNFLENFVRQNFDMVIVNFCSASQVASQTDDVKKFAEAINLFDYSILRAAAKCFEDTICVTGSDDFYNSINVNSYDRQKFALKAFNYLADYDTTIAEKIGEYSGEEKRRQINLMKLYELKYGSNPHQKASLYTTGEMADYKILNDKELTHNDILNITTASSIISEFYDMNAVAIVKNNLPCGVALGRNLYDAYSKAFDCDPFATFDGTVAFSQTVNFEIAKHLNSMDVKAVVAPYYDEDALELLRTVPQLKIVRLTTAFKDFKNIIKEDMTVTPFGTLVQETNKSELDKYLFKVVTKTKPTTEQLEDAIFAWKVAKFARTNGAVIAKDFKTVAIGQGQTNLVNAVEIAMNTACDNSKDAVLACDECIQSAACINAAVQGRISLIIQPGGGLKNREIIEAADKYGIAMAVTGIRNLKF